MKEKGHWSELGGEIYKRTFTPFIYPSFLFFFLIAVIIIGASGFWIEVVNYVQNVCGSSLNSIKKSLMGFFPVLAATACLQVIWNDDLKNFRGFIILLFVLSLIGLFVCARDDIADVVAIVFAAISSLIALWMWWMTNYNETYLRSTLDPDAPFGKNNPTEALSGGLQEFNY